MGTPLLVLTVMVVGIGLLGLDVTSGDGEEPAAGDGAVAQNASESVNGTDNSTSIPDLNVSCVVCTNAMKPEIKGLSNKKCLDEASSLPAEFTMNCKDYDMNMDKMFDFENKREGKGMCAITGYSICRSMYYEMDATYNYVSKDGEMPALTEDNKRVFRYCGCIYSTEPLPDDQQELKKQVFNGEKTVCKDVLKGKIRKRRCLCDPDKFSGKPCNALASQIQPIYLIFLLPIVWRLILISSNE